MCGVSRWPDGSPLAGGRPFLGVSHWLPHRPFAQEPQQSYYMTASSSPTHTIPVRVSIYPHPAAMWMPAHETPVTNDQLESETCHNACTSTKGSGWWLPSKRTLILVVERMTLRRHCFPVLLTQRCTNKWSTSTPARCRNTQQPPTKKITIVATHTVRQHRFPVLTMATWELTGHGHRPWIETLKAWKSCPHLARSLAWDVTAENSKSITLENQAEISRRRGERRTVIGTKTISENLYVDKRATYPGKKRGISHKHPKEKWDTSGCWGAQISGAPPTKADGTLASHQENSNFS